MFEWVPRVEDFCFSLREVIKVRISIGSGGVKNYSVTKFDPVHLELTCGKGFQNVSFTEDWQRKARLLEPDF